MPVRSFTSSDTSHRLAALAGSVRRCASLSLVEPEILGLSRIVRAGDVCFDVGAAYGMYSFPLAELAGPTGRVHAFEPQPKPRRVLAGARRVCGVRNLEVHRTAVGTEAGTREMAMPVRFGLPIHGHTHVRGSSSRFDGVSRRQRWFSRTRSWRTRVRSVDEFRAQRSIARVDSLKIDVEGFEPTVLEGARDTLAEDRPALLLEIEDRHLARYGADSGEFSRYLRGLGYGMYVWRGGNNRRGGYNRKSRHTGETNPGWTRTEEVTGESRNYLFATDETWDR